MRGKLRAIRVQNFKAVGDSGLVRLTPLTVFIGNNGSGKSSILEALQTLQRLVSIGLDGAMQAFKGMEHVRHKAVAARAARRPDAEEAIAYHAMKFLLWGSVKADASEGGVFGKFRSVTQLNATGESDRYFVEVDEVQVGPNAPEKIPVRSTKRIAAKELDKRLGSYLRRWQFLCLDPARMGEPAATRRTGGSFLLDPSGSNLADYLWHLVKDYGERGTAAWNNIVEALRFVLPYAGQAQPTMTTELERRSLLVLVERFGKEGQNKFEVPGWMLSTGTLRVLALLAVLKHPDPSPLICIEEIENGLDPRTLQLVVNEIQGLIETRRSQVIVTTHSPYLLGLLPLSMLVMTQRIAKGVVFRRPADDKDVRTWASDFDPGQLYLMGRFDKEEGS